MSLVSNGAGSIQFPTFTTPAVDPNEQADETAMQNLENQETKD